METGESQVIDTLQSTVIIVNYIEPNQVKHLEPTLITDYLQRFITRTGIINFIQLKSLSLKLLCSADRYGKNKNLFNFQSRQQQESSKLSDQ